MHIHFFQMIICYLVNLERGDAKVWLKDKIARFTVNEKSMLLIQYFSSHSLTLYSITVSRVRQSC